MQPLSSQNIRLRAMEPADIDLIYDWENDPETWTYSNTYTPFSRFYLEQYVLNTHSDIYAEKQLRLIIEDATSDAVVGCVDLFEFDPRNRRVGIGILVSGEFRKKGYASETIDVIVEYAKGTLALNQIFCNITENNNTSISLFKKKGFVISGTKQKWMFHNNSWLNEYFLQLIF